MEKILVSGWIIPKIKLANESLICYEQESVFVRQDSPWIFEVVRVCIAIAGIVLSTMLLLNEKFHVAAIRAIASEEDISTVGCD